MFSLKDLFISFFVVCLCAAPAVFAKPELQGGNVLAKGQCSLHGARAFCFLVEKDEVLYVVVHDRKGELFIFQVTNMPEDGNINDEHLTLLWSRGNA